jgi:DMSO/TMAO reductase YedYZ heme-binding membrane subunit
MARPPWHLRHVRGLLSLALGIVFVAILLPCLEDTSGNAFVVARESFALWALGLLLAAMIVGPLTYVVPGLPLKAHLVLGRRALGISAFGFASAHALSYVVPVGLRQFRELWSPGLPWLLGLAIGSVALGVLGLLALTSTDPQLIAIGGQRWKRWQESVYWLLPLLLLHAMLLGVDFGLSRAPDVREAPDSGSLVAMGSLSLAWLVLFALRGRKVRFSALGAGPKSPGRPR